MKEKSGRLPVWSRFLLSTALLTALLAWGLVLNVNTGSVDIPAGEVFRLTGGALRAAGRDLLRGGNALETLISASTESRIIFSIRMPRMLLAAILGGALSVSGFVSQVSSALMVLSAFAGSLVITGVVLLFSQRARNMSMLLVIGIMVGYICSAVTDFFITFAKEQDIVNLTSWSMGSFSGANWSGVGATAALCLGGLAAAWLLSKPMGAYALGEGYAQSLGINIKLFRAALILLSSLLSACVTAFAGPISFVGIAVPHITRSLLGTARPALVIPACYLCGAVFCIFCDLIARTAFAPAELAIGTVTSAFGAPVVIGMMLRRQRREQ